MNPETIRALLAAGLIDQNTADTMTRQASPEEARAWAESQLMQGFQGGLSAQEQRLLDVVQQSGFSPTERTMSRFWKAENNLLWKSIQPDILQIASEKTALSITDVNTFQLVNQNVIRWAEGYYTSAETLNYGSVPNLNQTSRTRFTEAFVRWQTGEVAFGGGQGLPALINLLTGIFGASRAEAIAVTETSRIFSQTILEGARVNEFTTHLRFFTAVDEQVCPICSPFNGRVIDKNSNGFGGIGWPPLHVRCRCSIGEETANTLRIPFNG